MPSGTSITYNPRMADIATGDRPRERLLAYGPSALSNAELLAVVLRVGGVGQNVMRLADLGAFRRVARPGAGQSERDHGRQRDRRCQGGRDQGGSGDWPSDTGLCTRRTAAGALARGCGQPRAGRDGDARTGVSAGDPAGHAIPGAEHCHGLCRQFEQLDDTGGRAVSRSHSAQRRRHHHRSQSSVRRSIALTRGCGGYAPGCGCRQNAGYRSSGPRRHRTRSVQLAHGAWVGFRWLMERVSKHGFDIL